MTNILTRSHSASSLFSIVFYSRKFTKKIFAELKREKAKVNILPEDSQSQKEKCRRPMRGPHLCQARVHPWPRLGVVWPPCVAPEPPLQTIYSIYPKNIGERRVFPERVPLRRRHPETSNWDQKSPFWHPAGMGNWRRSSPPSSPTPLHQSSMMPPSMCE